MIQTALLLVWTSLQYVILWYPNSYHPCLYRKIDQLQSSLTFRNLTQCIAGSEIIVILPQTISNVSPAQGRNHVLPWLLQINHKKGKKFHWGQHSLKGLTATSTKSGKSEQKQQNNLIAQKVIYALQLCCYMQLMFYSH